MIGEGVGAPQVAVRRSGPGAAPALFAAFPALAAAYAAGRAVVTILGDSTTFGLGAGSGGFYGTSGGANAVNPAAYLRAGLRAAGHQAIDGCAAVGTRNAFTATADAAAYYPGGALALPGSWLFGPSFGWSDQGPWGQYLGCNGAGGVDPVRFAPGFAWDRADLFFTCTPGNYTQGEALVNGARIGFSDWVGDARIARIALAKPLAADVLEVRRVTGNVTGLGAIRVWDGTRRHIQVETLGNPSWQAADWVQAQHPYSPLPGLDALGSHLFLINLGLNDRRFGRTAPAFKADLKAIAARARATGADVLLAVPTAAQPGSAYALDAAWMAAIGEVAAELGLPAPIDLRGIGLTAGDYYDEVHLTAAGYAKVGAAYAARLTG